MRRASRTLSCLLFLALLPAACGGTSSDTSSTSTADERTNTNTSENDVTQTDTGVVITLTRSAFPEQVNVPSGGSVVWVNNSSAPHEVQIDTHDGADVDMEPIRLGVDEQAEVSLEAGTWTYFCTIHSSMTGSLVVEG